jgi:hypothetical protein
VTSDRSAKTLGADQQQDKLLKTTGGKDAQEQLAPKTLGAWIARRVPCVETKAET